MKEYSTVTESFKSHFSILERTIRRHSGNIAEAATLIASCFNDGGKIVIFGNGGSAADSQHLAAEFMGRFLLERKSLPAIALTTDTSVLTALGNDYGFEKIFQRQVEGLVNNGDVVIAISTGGNSENVLNGAKAAKEKGAKVIALTGQGGGKLREVADVLIDIPSKETPRIQEVHILVEHIICDLVERCQPGTSLNPQK